MSTVTLHTGAILGMLCLLQPLLAQQTTSDFYADCGNDETCTKGRIEFNLCSRSNRGCDTCIKKRHTYVGDCDYEDDMITCRVPEDKCVLVVNLFYNNELRLQPEVRQSHPTTGLLKYDWFVDINTPTMPNTTNCSNKISFSFLQLPDNGSTRHAYRFKVKTCAHGRSIDRSLPSPSLYASEVKMKVIYCDCPSTSRHSFVQSNNEK